MVCSSLYFFIFLAINLVSFKISHSTVSSLQLLKLLPGIWQNTPSWYAPFPVLYVYKEKKKQMFLLNMFTRHIWETHCVQGDVFWHFFTEHKTELFAVSVFTNPAQSSYLSKQWAEAALVLPWLCSHRAN